MPGDLENLNKKVKELVDGMKSSFQKASANISGHVGEVLSDEIKMTTDTVKSIGSSAKDSSMKILKFFGAGWTLELKSFAVDKKQLKVLEKIESAGKKEKLSRLAQFKKTKGAKFLAAILDLLGIPLAILAAGLGAIVGQILLPFRAIYKILKPFFVLFGKLTRIGKLFSKISAIGKIAKMIKAFKWLGGLFGFLLRLPGLRVIAYGLKVGFTKLFLPLQILLSTIDFVTGFMKTEGTIMDKIKGGIKNVIMKFIEWPVHVMGKFIDWLFGMEAGTSEAAMIKGVEVYIDLFFKYFNIIFTPIKEALGWLVDLLQTTSWKDVTDTIDNIKKWCVELPGRLLDYLKELWNAMLESKIVSWFTPEGLREALRFKGSEKEEKARKEKLDEARAKADVEKIRLAEEQIKATMEIAAQFGGPGTIPMQMPSVGIIPEAAVDPAMKELMFSGGAGGGF